MTQTAQLTCAALYDYDLTFQAAIGKWVADRRCPVELADYLRENGLYAAAECADWCATEPDREVYLKPRGDETPCGPYPCEWREGKKENWYFCQFANGSIGGILRHANAVWSGNLKSGFYGIVASCQSPQNAILGLLDIWKGKT